MRLQGDIRRDSLAQREDRERPLKPHHRPGHIVCFTDHTEVTLAGRDEKAKERSKVVKT